MFHRAKPQRPSVGSPSDVEADGAFLPDEAAYRLIEEARLRCLRRREQAAGAEQARWEGVRCELGMAGYVSSVAIPSGQRRALLARAREASSEPARSAEHDEYAILELISSAAKRAREALHVTAPPDHMQQADEHLGRARHMLVRALSEHRTRSTSAA